MDCSDWVNSGADNTCAFFDGGAIFIAEPSLLELRLAGRQLNDGQSMTLGATRVIASDSTLVNQVLWDLPRSRTSVEDPEQSLRSLCGGSVALVLRGSGQQAVASIYDLRGAEELLQASAALPGDAAQRIISVWQRAAQVLAFGLGGSAGQAVAGRGPQFTRNAWPLRPCFLLLARPTCVPGREISPYYQQSHSDSASRAAKNRKT